MLSHHSHMVELRLPRFTVSPSNQEKEWTNFNANLMYKQSLRIRLSRSVNTWGILARGWKRQSVEVVLHYDDNSHCNEMQAGK